MVDAVNVEFTVITLVFIVLPRIVMVFNVVIIMVDAAILDADITLEVIELPIIVENVIFPPHVMVEPLIVDTTSVLP